jgi:hypothetical protein
VHLKKEINPGTSSPLIAIKMVNPGFRANFSDMQYETRSVWRVFQDEEV